MRDVVDRNRKSRRGAWILAGLGLLLATAWAAGALRAQGFGGPSGAFDLEVVKQFDANGDGRLDAAERKPAREWLSKNSGGRGGFGRRRFGFGGAANGNTPQGRHLEPKDVRSYPKSAGIYDISTFRTIFLQFDNTTDWEDELAAFYGTDVEIPATVTVDGATYKDVGVHFRGASSFRMVPDGVKRSLNLSFNFVNKKQRLGGYRTLNLLNGNGDPTFMRAVLYSEISRHYVPTAKMNYVRVVINGEDWGAYINAQQVNSDFTREWFSSTNGVRWKTPGSPRGRAGMEYLGEATSLYKRLYEIKTEDTPQAWTDLIHMFRVLNETPADKLESALAPILDIDGVLKFLAVEVALGNTDGYWTRASDYHIYQDPKGVFHVFAHDFNEALMEQGFGFGGGSGPTLDPLVSVNDPTKPLRSKLLNVPALRARYLGYMREIAEKWLDWRTLEPLVNQYRALLVEEMKVDTRKLYTLEAFQAGIGPGPDTLREFVDRRRAYLLKIATPAPAAADRR
jgi:hypothetical protein